MRITKPRLKEIIREELQNILEENLKISKGHGRGQSWTNYDDDTYRMQVTKDANQILFQKIARYNAAAARFGAYTWTAGKEGGLRDAMWLGLGLFPTKEQRDMNTWVQEKLGWKEKKKGKKFKSLKERLNEKGIEDRLQKDLLDKDKILRSLDLLR